MGLGPAHLVRCGAGSQLRALGHEVSAETVTLAEEAAARPAEVATTFAAYRALARRVAQAVDGGALPVVLSGNCGSAIGTVAGLRGARPADEVAVVWLDAHGDFNTPETTTSGFVDGMALAALTGRCWAGMTAAVPGFRAVPEENVLLVGARDLDPGELAALDGSRVTRLPVAALRARGVDGALAPELARLAAGSRRVYLHVDLDVLDPDRVGRANALAPAGGLTAAEAAAAAAAVARTGALAAVCLASYDPAHDADAAVWRAAVELLGAAAAGPAPAG
jgi:arginase